MKRIHLHSCLAIAFYFLVACGQQTDTTASYETETDENEGFTSMFDGRSLDGWDGDPAYWRVEEETLIGEITEGVDLPHNTFLIWQKSQPGDFEMKGEFKISESGNSGIQYRSEKLEDIPYALKGYQADMDGKHNYTGQNYEERKRTTLAYIGQKTRINPQEKEGDLRANIERNAWLGLEVVESLGDQDSLRSLMHKEDWNEFRIVAEGNRLQHFINGVLISDVTDDDPANRAMEGYLGIQVHRGPPMKVALKNLYLKEQ
ncbi:3-keto-disaccharide hydrolase [Pleomorphovibrio marinus]|uniref:3-keto-disaccharide hydrolase n=1 Tax=Pleomorphovibrio marinus TaxID=2164132 RepID=UPI000E0B6643|nr:DUF1080 domain-containing protein [Pleomorphovibrio marinus]